MPAGRSLYGPLPDQLEDPSSFARRLSRIIAVRRRHGIATATQVDVPDVSHRAMLVMVHRLDGDRPAAGHGPELLRRAGDRHGALGAPAAGRRRSPTCSPTRRRRGRRPPQLQRLARRLRRDRAARHAAGAARGDRRDAGGSDGGVVRVERRAQVALRRLEEPAGEADGVEVVVGARRDARGVELEDPRTGTGEQDRRVGRDDELRAGAGGPDDRGEERERAASPTTPPRARRARRGPRRRTGWRRAPGTTAPWDCSCSGTSP